MVLIKSKQKFERSKGKARKESRVMHQGSYERQRGTKKTGPISDTESFTGHPLEHSLVHSFGFTAPPEFPSSYETIPFQIEYFLICTWFN